MGRKKRKFFRGVTIGVAGTLVAASIGRELSRPPAERTWQGNVAGVPYDWRPPTGERLRSTWWAPEDAQVLKPTAFGVGWDLNLGRVARWASEALGRRSAW